MALADNYEANGVKLLFDLIEHSSKQDFFNGGLELCLHVYKRDTSVKVAIGGLVPKNLEASRPLADPRQYVPLVNGSNVPLFSKKIGDLATNDPRYAKEDMQKILDAEIRGLREFDQGAGPTPLDGYFHFILSHEVYMLANTPSQIHKNEIQPVQSH